jgi:hypothetical protein
MINSPIVWKPVILIPTQDSGSATQSEGEQGPTACDLMPGRKSRSLSSLPYECQKAARLSNPLVVDYTLFKKPLLSAGEIELLVRDVWHKTQMEPRQVEKPREFDNYVC